MASEKIVNKILEDSKTECEDILKNARLKAEAETKAIKSETEKKLKTMSDELRKDMDATSQRLKLTTQLDERKDLLRVKRKVLDEAFDLAKKKLTKLPIEEWRAFILQIIIDAVNTDTQYLKVPEKDFDRYLLPMEGGITFLDIINEALVEIGLNQELILDANPAHFRDGVMLIGKYSDVNASFDVLLENMREQLEYPTTQILFEENRKEGK